MDRGFESMSFHSCTLLDIFNRISEQLKPRPFPPIQRRAVRIAFMAGVGRMEPSGIDGLWMRHETKHQSS